ncbi:hypothetical protein PIB30_004016 [Stylosanthes scabra]|uniref:Uncharacterized protein n=1 Tax=Stylosanthes scabra TaxID=79078 RepID=A0ABU6X4D7_9FABA|nr:hypothetical protein [Stylosanthes scabra]
MATLVVPPIPPSARDDAMNLDHALTDAAQRAEIEQEYKAIHTEELSASLEKGLHGKLESAMLLWMHDPAARDAVIIRQCLAVDSSFHGATEVICSRTHSHMQHVNEIYLSKFGASVEHDVEAHTSGDYKKILLAYLSNPREEEEEVDKELAGKDAKAMYKAGEKRLGTDEDTFIQIFTERSAPHLVAVNSYYNHVHAHSLRKVQLIQRNANANGVTDSVTKVSTRDAMPFAELLES